MKKAIKAKWLKALRSRKYKQGRGALHHLESNSYCCLGVLCDVMGVPEDKVNVKNGMFAGSSNYLTEILLTKFSLREGDTYTLANMNDGGDGVLRKSFITIAKYIEEKL